ncbi:ribbon-helix-helix protein, CopG family [Candidatus Woesearchaeota archaeon]|nr:ribbon-helix-helix protein, CopG family [Candidatus Woesearchaeota archaeon]
MKIRLSISLEAETMQKLLASSDRRKYRNRSHLVEEAILQLVEARK